MKRGLIMSETSLLALNLLETLRNHVPGDELVTIDPPKEIPPKPKLLPTVTYGIPRKPRKDKSGVKRYSSYFNKINQP